MTNSWHLSQFFIDYLIYFVKISSYPEEEERSKHPYRVLWLQMCLVESSLLYTFFCICVLKERLNDRYL